MVQEEARDGFIRVRDAAEHNLRHVDLAVPRDRVVAFTGVSGSGKSSLAFATIYAEAQRRYLESVAPYARRLMEQAAVPRVGDITGLPPAVALRQTHAGASSRSTVGTVSRLSNVLRMLYSRAGTYPPDLEPLDSDSFSPNTAVGACPTCSGLGRLHSVDDARLVGDPDLSIRDGAIAAWPGAWQGKNYRDILAVLGVDVDAPFRTLPPEQRTWLLTTDEQPVVTVNPVREAHRITRPYQGTYLSPRAWVLRTYASTKSASLRAKAASFMTEQLCPACLGRRLHPDALRVTVAGLDIARATALPLTELAAFLAAAAGHPDTDALPPAQRQAARALITNLAERISDLVELGLGYLASERATTTLSAGELQRLHLGDPAAQRAVRRPVRPGRTVGRAASRRHDAAAARAGPAARRGQRRPWSSSTTPRSSRPRTGSWTWGRAPGATAAACSTAARPAGSPTSRSRRPRATCRGTRRWSSGRRCRATPRPGSRCATSPGTTCATSRWTSRSAR